MSTSSGSAALLFTWFISALSKSSSSTRNASSATYFMFWKSFSHKSVTISSSTASRSKSRAMIFRNSSISGWDSPFLNVNSLRSVLEEKESEVIVLLGTCVDLFGVKKYSFCLIFRFEFIPVMEKVCKSRKCIIDGFLIDGIVLRIHPDGLFCLQQRLNDILCGLYVFGNFHVPKITQIS